MITAPVVSLQLNQDNTMPAEKGLSVWLYGPVNKLKAKFSQDNHFNLQDDQLNNKGVC